MHTISEFLAPDHSRCDDLFASAEEAIARSDWDKGGDLFLQFSKALSHHFAMEEQVLFPAFETHTGMSMGPTQVMRSEHAQMRDLLEQLDHAQRSRNQQGYLGLSETLLLIMQQHNLKEEQMLYRMADQALAGARDEIIGQMKKLDA